LPEPVKAIKTYKPHRADNKATAALSALIQPRGTTKTNRAPKKGSRILARINPVILVSSST